MCVTDTQLAHIHCTTRLKLLEIHLVWFMDYQFTIVDYSNCQYIFLSTRLLAIQPTIGRLVGPLDAVVVAAAAAAAGGVLVIVGAMVVCC